MSKNIYLTTTEVDPAKITIVLELIELISKKVNKIAYFKPIIHVSESRPISYNFNLIKPYFNLSLSDDQMYAFTFEEAEKLIADGKKNELFKGIVKKYKELEAEHDFIFCDGTYFEDATSLSKFEMGLNAKIASTLACPILILTPAKNKDINDIILSAKITNNYFINSDCDIIGTILNDVHPPICSKLLTALHDEKLLANQYLAVIPQDPAFDEQNRQIDLETFATQSRRLQAFAVKSSNQAALNIIETNLDIDALIKAIIETPSVKITPELFECELIRKAKTQKKHIVLPESFDDRILQAAQYLIAEDIVDITLLGDEAEIKSKTKSLALDLKDVKIVDPKTSDLTNKYAEAFYELRKNKGVTPDAAKKLIAQDSSYFGTMMVHMGDADGMVSGASHSTADTIRPGFQIIKTKPGISIVSSVFLMCLADKVYVYGDCAVNPNPTAEELAIIAISSAETGQAFGIDPKVALLSYSTGSSGAGPDVDMVKEATAIAKKTRPDLKIEGPLQYDAAVSKSVAATKMPNSEVAGKATIFVFPNLNAGNNAYKAVQRETGAIAIGPILQGLNKPINDLSRGCTVPDIINTVIITAIQSQN